MLFGKFQLIVNYFPVIILLNNDSVSQSKFDLPGHLISMESFVSDLSCDISFHNYKPKWNF